MYNCPGFYQVAYCHPNVAILDKCDQIPKGVNNVVATHAVQIHFYDKHKSHEWMSQSPCDIYANYVRDCSFYNQYGFLMRIIFIKLLTISYYYLLNIDNDCNTPGISIHLDLCFNSDSCVQSDFVIAGKDKGFLNQHSADFSFVVTDRGASIDKIHIHTYISVWLKSLEVQASMILRRLGFPSGLALTYRPGNKDSVQILLSVPEIWIPLFLLKPNLLCNSNIKNHPTAL